MSSELPGRCFDVFAKRNERVVDDRGLRINLFESEDVIILPWTNNVNVHEF